MNKFNTEALKCIKYFAEREEEFLAEMQAIIDSSVPVRSYRFIYPEPCPALERQARLYNWLVRPMLAHGFELARVGGCGDGAYVMPDPAKGAVAYSLGIAQEVGWDLDMASRGFEVYQYDGSIDAPPVSHPSFHFEKCFIGGHKELPEGWKSLSAILVENGHAGRDDLILQIDIEGAEWDVFSSLQENALRSFRQIIVELHAPLNELPLLPARNAILRLLGLYHQVVHVHVNNTGPSVQLGRENFWAALEVTYLRRDNYEFFPSPLHYPLDLDAPCSPMRSEPSPGYWGLLELLPK